MFALVDVNNFYASCECVFDVRLRGKPLVVLSNNDGCVIARSAEAKSLGIAMGEPWHEVRKKHPQLIHRSSNYALYGDMSARVMSILTAAAPAVEVYSIDESFLDVDGVNDRAGMGRDVRTQIRDWTGLPVCIGIGSTKTRAKFANHVAKKRAEHCGVFDLEMLAYGECQQLMSEIDVGEVWGVGRRLKERLKKLEIHTVRDLHDADSEWIRDHSSVVLQRTAEELRGVSCIALELVTPQRKQLVVSRSFGKEVQGYTALRESVIAYVSRAGEKLRKENLLARLLHVFIHTNTFRADRAQYSNAFTLKLPAATDDTLALSHAASFALQKIYRDGFAYKKAGVLLGDLSPKDHRQLAMFVDPLQLERRGRLNETLDRINHRFGRETLRVVASGVEPTWSMQRSALSPQYTTNWEELAIAHAT